MPDNDGFGLGKAERAVFSYINDRFHGRPFTYSELMRQHERDTGRIGMDWDLDAAVLRGALGSLVGKDILDRGVYEETGFLSYVDELDTLETLYTHLEEVDGWYLKNSFRQDVAEDAVTRDDVDRLAAQGLVSRHGGITYVYPRGWRAMFHAADITVFEDPYRRAYRV